MGRDREKFESLCKKKLKSALDGLPTGVCLLDAGCGEGKFICFLKSMGYQVSGFDISATAINAAKETNPDIEFKIASLEEKIPFPDNKFTGVWCSEVLEHLLDVHGALTEINRVLIEGGLFVLTVPYHGIIKNLAIALHAYEAHYNPYISHIRFYTKRSLRDCLSRAGFSIMRWEGIGRYWPLWMSIFVVARKTGCPKPRPAIIG
jgi:ubiquinone/menaquinone biosynthesis C-methylase UbiE